MNIIEAWNLASRTYTIHHTAPAPWTEYVWPDGYDLMQPTDPPAVPTLIEHPTPTDVWPDHTVYTTTTVTTFDQNGAVLAGSTVLYDAELDPSLVAEIKAALAAARGRVGA